MESEAKSHIRGTVCIMRHLALLWPGECHCVMHDHNRDGNFICKGHDGMFTFLRGDLLLSKNPEHPSLGQLVAI